MTPIRWLRTAPIDFWHATVSTWWGSDAGERSEAEIFRDQIDMLAQAIACPLDLDHDGVVQKAVQQGGGDNRVPKEITPFGEATV